MDIISSKTREKFVRKLYALTKKSKVSMPLKTAKQIENAIYDYMLNQNEKDLRARRIYCTKMLSIYQNLKNTKSFMKRLKSEEITPEQMPYMTPQKVAPEVWKDCITRREHEEKLIETTRGAIITTMYECGKCHHNECEIYELQTRGVDEGTTIFLTCTNCGNKWKQ